MFLLIFHTSAAGGTTYEESISVSVNAGVSSAASAVFESAAALAITGGISPSPNNVINAEITIENEMGHDDGGNDITLEDSVTFGITNGLTVSSSGTFETSLSLAIAAGLSASSTAVMGSSATIAASLGISATGGNIFDEAATLAATFAASVTDQRALNLAATIAAQLGAGASVQIHFGPSVSIDLSTALAAASIGIFNSGVTFAGRFNVAASSSIVGVTVTTPDNRIILISADDRTITIQ